MHRIPATLRSYDIATIYVMQDKIQNDLMYGDKASRAILSNLSYQFFGKVHDPDTAKYYERFFEIVKKETTSVNRGHNLDFDTRVTTGEKEVSKIRADTFFRLKEGEFIAYADGKDRKGHFALQKIEKELPSTLEITPETLRETLTGSIGKQNLFLKSYPSRWTKNNESFLKMVHNLIFFPNFKR